MSPTATAPGKIVLLGEYAVLDGAPALVAAVDRRVRVTVSSADRFSIRAPEIRVDEATFELSVVREDACVHWSDTVSTSARERLAFLAACLRDVALQTGSLPPVEIVVDSRAMTLSRGGPKLGIGSSAAVSVATVAALLAHAEDGIGLEQRQRTFDLARGAHARAQGGVGSGIDVAAATFGGLLRYERPADGAAPVCDLLDPPSWLDPICVWSGRPASTRQRIESVAELARREPDVYRRLMAELGAASAAGCVALSDDAPQRFFAAVRASYQALEKIGAAADVDIVSAEHCRVADVVGSRGGVYKPSGAGGGDLGLAFAASAEDRSGLQSAVEEAGFRIVAIELGGPGVEAEIEAEIEGAE